MQPARQARPQPCAPKAAILSRAGMGATLALGGWAKEACAGHLWLKAG